MKINEKQLAKLIRESLKKALREDMMDPELDACKNEVEEFVQGLWTKYSPTIIAEALSYVIEEVQGEADDYDKNVLQYPTQ